MIVPQVDAERENSVKKEEGALAGVAQWTKHWPKGEQFDSQSGHMPGSWARSPVGGT